MISSDEAVHLVKETVALICRTPVDQLTEDTRPQDIKGWDSFGRLQVVLELERRIGHTLPLEEAVAMDAIREIAAVVIQAAA